MNLLKPERIRSETYRRYVASQPCAVPGCNRVDVQAAHVRLGLEGGTSLKPGDDLTWPLCLDHHAEFDQGQERFLERHFPPGFFLKAWLRGLYERWAA